MEEFWRACMNMMMGSGGVLMMLVMILFWLGVVALVVLAIRWLWRQQAGSDPRSAEEPLEILRRRYAAGEIDQEEFERCRAAAEQAISEPFPDAEDATLDVYTDSETARPWTRADHLDPTLA